LATLVQTVERQHQVRADIGKLPTRSATTISRRKRNGLTRPVLSGNLSAFHFFRWASLSVDAGLVLSHFRDQVFAELSSSRAMVPPRLCTTFL
jgi:hypothetical protein